MNAEVRDELQEDWISETGLACQIRPCRFTTSYHLCGYVQIPVGHPLHGLDYNTTVPKTMDAAKEAVLAGPVGKRGIIDIVCQAVRDDMRVGFLFNVHGGITYSRKHDDGTFWYGFDCGHCDDTIYNCNSAYVRAECESLAKQIQELA